MTIIKGEGFVPTIGNMLLVIVLGYFVIWGLNYLAPIKVTTVPSV